MYLIGAYKNDELNFYLSGGRPSTTRVYASLASAKKRISLDKEYYGVRGIELRILEITSLEEVKINE